MRALALLAAITMIHTVHAFPRPSLTVRQGVNDLNNESHVFHHLDRNQRAAYRDRERVHVERAEVVDRMGERPQRAAWTMVRRFMRSPDYSEEGSTSNSTMTTQPPAAKVSPGRSQ